MLTNHRHLLISVLLALGAALPVIRYLRRRLPAPRKITLIALRAAWVAVIALSFFEPAIRFERFESGAMKIPVLVDVSASMKNFSPQESVAPFLDTLASLQSRGGERVRFEYFLFGDSTRASQSPPSAPLPFDDTKSFFPAALPDAGGRLSGDMVIITDGHWTRPRGSGEVFPRNTIHYLVLPDASPNPFVTVTCDAPESSPSDSSFTVTATASGYVQEAGTLTLSLKEKGRVVKTETMEIERGYFTRAARFRASNSRPGRRLYTVEASVDTAAPPSVIGFVHQTIPSFLTYSMYSAKPTLDRRQISQALASNRFFRERAASPDVLFLFDWDTTAERLARALPRHAAAVFLGCMPCSSSRIAEPSLTIRRADDNASAISPNLDLRSMPPPQEIIACAATPSRGTKRLLTATVNTTAGAASANASAARDNLTILSTGRFRGTQSLFCPVRGIWRWDFWPMSSDRAENELFGFSNAILAIAKETLLDNISDQLIIYPAGALTETDSARFLMSLPAASPVFEPVKLSIRVQNGGVRVDTAITYTPTGQSRQPLALAPLPPGRYGMAASLEGGGVTAAFSDSVTVNKDMSELSVLAQNTQYLREFAQPLDPRDSAAANALFSLWSHRGAERNTVTETVRIHRSWLLLGIALALIGAELALRKFWGID